MEISLFQEGKNLEQVQGGLKPLKNGSEELFVESLRGTKVFNSRMEQLKEVLRYAMVKIGLREKNYPVDKEKILLIDHVFKNYPNHTIQEIRLAFDMAITGKLEVDPNCYENFSCMYFSSIMNAYRKWAVENIKYVKNKEAMNLSEVGNKVIESNKEISDHDMKQWLMEWKERIKKEKDASMVPLMFYDWLEKKGWLKLTPQEKNDLLPKAATLRHLLLIKQIESEGKHGQGAAQLEEFTKMKKEGFVGLEKLRIIDLAKKIAVFEWLKSH